MADPPVGAVFRAHDDSIDDTISVQSSASVIGAGLGPSRRNTQVSAISRIDPINEREPLASRGVAA